VLAYVITTVINAYCIVSHIACSLILTTHLMVGTADGSKASTLAGSIGTQTRPAHRSYVNSTSIGTWQCWNSEWV